MLILTATDPMQFAVRCDGCGARAGPVEGTREEAVRAYAQLSWRLDERFTKSALCPKCAGPPSVFPAARVTEPPSRCSECGGNVDRCRVCDDDLVESEVISCRRAHGHAHARCATQKVSKFSPPE